MKLDTWRGYAAPIISRVIAAHQGKTEKEIRMALRKAYPFGERAMWPYKVWCDEVNVQLHAPRHKPKNDPAQLALL